MAHPNHDSQLDELCRLTTSITASTAGTAVNGTVASIDLGQQARQYAGASGATDTSAPVSYGRFRVLVDIGAQDNASGDERYDIELQGSDTSAFTNAYRLGILQVGNGNLVGYPGAAADTPPNCRRAFFCDNVYYPDATRGDVFAHARYVRLRVTPAGTTPSITITGAWLLPV